MQDPDSIPVEGTKSPTCFGATKSAFSPQLEKPAHHTEDPAKPKEKQKTLFVVWVCWPRNKNLLTVSRASPVAQWSLKNPPAMQEIQEMQVQSLGWEEPLEEGMATHPSILAWRTLWTEEPEGLQSAGSQRVRHDWGCTHYTPQVAFVFKQLMT